MPDYIYIAVCYTTSVATASGKRVGKVEKTAIDTRAVPMPSTVLNSTHVKMKTGPEGRSTTNLQQRCCIDVSRPYAWAMHVEKLTLKTHRSSLPTANPATPVATLQHVEAIGRKE